MLHCRNTGPQIANSDGTHSLVLRLDEVLVPRAKPLMWGEERPENRKCPEPDQFRFGNIRAGWYWNSHLVTYLIRRPKSVELTGHLLAT